MISISVVIPCYNVALFIEEGLRSVLAQTKSAHEIICVDDGSKDETVSIINKLQLEFPQKIKLFINDGNRGATYSRNRGLAVATGDYIQFFDADDLLVPDKFEYQSALIENSQIKPHILIGSLKKLFIDGTIKEFIYSPRNPWNGLMDGMLGVTTANLFEKQKLIEVKGWTDELKSSQEYDLMFRMMQHNATVLIDSRIVCTNRERVSGSITKSNPTEKWKRFISLRVRIYDHLKKINQVSDEINRTYISIVFDAIRILYKYNKEEAFLFHDKYIKGVGIPTVSFSTSSKYLLFYKLFGFKYAEQIAAILNSQNKEVH